MVFESIPHLSFLRLGQTDVPMEAPGLRPAFVKFVDRFPSLSRFTLDFSSRVGSIFDNCCMGRKDTISVYCFVYFPWWGNRQALLLSTLVAK